MENSDSSRAISLKSGCGSWRDTLRAGTVIPAMPLALNAERQLDERRQRALVRYYLAAGAGGIAVGVHTTQFQIREPKHNLFRPVLELVADEIGSEPGPASLVRVAGICGKTTQAVSEAHFARDFKYSAGLLSLSAMRDASLKELIRHCQEVASVLPIIGFYLQPAAGGIALPFAFWRRFAELDQVVAVKIAAFNRYETLNVVRAFAEAGRDDVALYTGNDDNIVHDLLTPYRLLVNGRQVEQRIVGGLLGQWAVWTRAAVQLFERCRKIARDNDPVPAALLATAIRLTDCNAAIFDVAHQFRGCIPGIHEVLRSQGLLAGNWCLDPFESLGPGQQEEIERVRRSYPELTDDEFVAENLDDWLRG